MLKQHRASGQEKTAGRDVKHSSVQWVIQFLCLCALMAVPHLTISLSSAQKASEFWGAEYK